MTWLWLVGGALAILTRLLDENTSNLLLDAGCLGLHLVVDWLLDSVVAGENYLTIGCHFIVLLDSDRIRLAVG